MTTLVQRTLILRSAAGAEIRHDSCEGQECTVLPVVALVGNQVIHAVNAPAPEFVPAAEIENSLKEWNGRTLTIDHPILDGDRVSANSPRAFERFKIGHIFNAAFRNDRLIVEAWIEHARTAKLGGEAARLLERIAAGEVIEVSVGAFIAAEAARGEHDGQPYEAVWRRIGPDHLAMLPEGYTGACSVEMGCGAPRSARAYLVTATGLEAIPYETPAPTPDKETSSMKHRILGRVAEFLRLAKPAATDTDLRSILATLEEGMSDMDLREALDRALRKMIPGYLGIEDVYPGESEVIYASAPEDAITWHRQGYSLAEDGEVTLDGEALEVKPETAWRPVAAMSCACGSSPDSCTCSTATHHHIAKGEKEKTMSKFTERARALIESEATPYTEEDQGFLEGATEDQLDRIEASYAETPEPVAPPAEPAQAAAAPKTKDEWLLSVPAEVRETFAEAESVVAEKRQREDAEKASLILQLAKKTAYAEEELKAKDLADLRSLARTVNIETKRPVDFGPRAATPDKKDDRSADAAPTFLEMWHPSADTGTAQ